MDVSTLKQFLNSTHTYKGLDKLNVFSDNKMKNKPLKWWLQQMDEAPMSDEPFNVTKFITTYRILSQKKLRSSEYMNEVLDWAVNNKAKFRAGLQNSKMVQYRPNITKNEQIEQEREKEAVAEAEKTNEEKKAFRTIASFLNKEANEKYNVVSKRNGKETIWNKKPMSDKEADEMVRDLQKAKIPSVDQKTIRKEKVK